jgi:hypothetical protein
VRLGGVRVAPDAIAELAAEHLIDRHVVSLTREIPQGHLDAAHAATLARVAAELLDLPEQPVDVARILVQQPALEHQRVLRAGAVADLAEAIDSLVGVDADQRARHRRPRHRRHPQIRDLQRRRLRVRVRILWQRIQRLVRPEAGAQQAGRGLEERSSIGNFHFSLPFTL